MYRQCLWLVCCLLMAVVLPARAAAQAWPDAAQDEDRAYTASCKSVRGRLLVPVSILGTGPFWFLLDTGTVVPVLDAAIADTLGLERKALTTGEDARAGNTWYASVADFAPGNLPGQPMDLVVTGLDTLAQPLGEPVKGVLPAHLPGYEVSLDFAESKITWRPLDAASLSVARGNVMPMQVDKAGRPRVQALVGKAHLLDFVLDMAEPALMTLSQAQREDVAPADAPEINIKTPDRESTAHVRLGALALGPIRIAKPIAVVHPGSEARLGLGFLRRFEVTLNYEFGLARFALDGDNHLVDPPAAGTGLLLHHRQEGLWSVRVAVPSPAHDAALRPGDLLVAIDGQACDGLPASAIEELLACTPGSAHTIEVRRDDRRLRATIACVELL
ncbi:MAG: PDZ domain-containing protein [Candidatus Hydrogenedentota bacterium]